MTKITYRNVIIFNVVVLLAGMLFFGTNPSAFVPESRFGINQNCTKYTEKDEEKRLKSKIKPEKWEATAHGADLGFQWEAAQLRTLEHIRSNFYATDVTERNTNYGPFQATWIEKGPSRIPGRVTASAVLPLQNRIYLMTDGGYIFRGTIDGNYWTCLNDHNPLVRDVSARLSVLSLPNGTRRIIVGGWDYQNLGQKCLKYSDDEGLTWQVPNGLPNANWYRRTIADQNGMVWHLVHTTVAGSPKMALLYSTDYGENFTQLYAFDLPASDHDRRCDIWKPADENEIYGIFGDQMIRIATDGSTLALGTVSNTPNPEWVILAGGRSGNTGLYTFYVRVWNGSNNIVYRSTDGGQNWGNWAILADGLHSPFSLYSFVTNPSDPSKLYAGGWIVGEKADGVDWRSPHDLGGYVGYHGDVPDMNFVKNPATDNYDFYIGTDGGFYKYLPSTDTFISLSKKDLNNTQIYKMVSDHTVEHNMYIGTQDNGFSFNHTATAATDKAPFDYYWGGDVTQVVSGDKGHSFWCFWWGLGCNYVKDAAQIQTSGIANWAPIYDSEYWELPAKADPQTPDECLVAGYKTPSPDGSFLVRLKAPADLQDGDLKALEQTYSNYDFKAASGGGRIGAIGISPINNQHLYVMTDNGVFFWSLDKGQTWSKNDVARNKIWVRYIAVSPTNPGEVFIGGAGYDGNTPCWRTTDHGQFLQPAEAPNVSILKDNRVNALCFSPDGKYVFAAADVAAFVYVIADKKWQIISGNPAPISAFHDVEYLENSNTVRFATYSRGVWDFKIEGLVSGAQSLGQQKLPIKIYPNPAVNEVVIHADHPRSLVVSDQSGKIVYTEAFDKRAPNSIRLDIQQWIPGIYWVLVKEQSGQQRAGRLIKM